MSQHKHLSAFDGIDFGANDRGIQGATPTDLMHAFLEGACKYVVRLVIDPLTSGQKAELDFLVDHLFGYLRSSEKKHFL